MTIGTCEIVGKEEWEGLVTIQYRGADEEAIRTLSVKRGRSVHSSPNQLLIIKVTPEKPGNWGVIYF